MADAMMMFLGEAHGVNWYWAQPGEFENPGAYYWDGAKNVLCVPHLSAPETPAQGDPLEKLTRIQEELGLYDDQPAQPIPAPWREAVKVARGLLGQSRPYVQSGLHLTERGSQSQSDIFKAADLLRGIDAALAQLDALEGGE